MTFSKRILSAILVLVLVFSCAPVASFAANTPDAVALKDSVNAEAPVGENKPAAEPKDNSPAEITRAEWVHELVSLFSGNGKKEYVDGYFSDLSQADDYYNDVMQALEFGAIEIAEGESFYPAKKVTRDFAAHTLNAYLGYIVEEGKAYDFSETDLAHPADAQIATERGWFALDNGKFSEEKQITKSELEFMLSDAKQALEAVDVDADYESEYNFQDDVIEVPSDTQVEIDDNENTVTVYDADISIKKGNRFVIYTGDLPICYIATAVKEEGDALVISTQKAQPDAIEAIDAQGTLALTEENCCVEAASYEPQSGPEISIGDLTFQDGKISAKMTGVEGQSAEIYVSNLFLNHSFSDSGYSITLNGSWGYTGNMKVTGGISDFTLGEIRIYGVGVIKLSFSFTQSMSMTADVKGTFSTGLAVDADGSKRIIKDFTTNSPYVEGKGEMEMAIKLSAGVDILLASADVYAEIGMKTQYTSRANYNQSTQKSVHCQDFKYYIFTEVGAAAKYYAFWAGKQQTLASTQLDLPDNIAKPFIVQVHFEDGVRVSSCSFGMQVEDLNYGGKSGTFTSTVAEDNRARATGTDIKLPSDLTVDNDYTIDKGTLDLNGHVLTINGDLIQTGGTIKINSGRLIIKGDYRIQGEEWKPSEGILSMSNYADQLDIDGDFVVQSNQKSYPSNGIIRLKGSFYQYNTNKVTSNFSAGSGLTVSMCGNGNQTIYFESSEDKSFGFVKAESNFSVSNGIYTYGMNVNGHSVTVSGNYQQRSETLLLNGGTVTVNGDAIFAFKNSDGSYSPTNSGCKLTMNNESDLFVIHGNLVTYFQNSGSEMNCSNGKMKLYGNWTNYYHTSNSGSFELVLAGDKSQSIINNTTNSYKIIIPILTVHNQTSRNISTKGIINISVLNTKNVSFTAVDGPTLSIGTTVGDIDISGNVTLSISTKADGDITVNGNLYSQGIQLGGHNLTVSGNYQQRSETLLLNGGTVTVNGDAIFAFKNSDGSYSPTNSGCKLTMNNESDLFVIHGNFITYFQNSRSEMNCSNGKMKLYGNWTNYYHTSNSGSFELVLAGDKSQSIINNTTNYYKIIIPILTVHNQTSRNISTKGIIDISVLNTKNVSFTAVDGPTLSIGTTVGDIDINGDVTLSISTKAGGNISVDGDLTSEGIMLAGLQLSVTGRLYLTSSNTLKIGKDGVCSVNGELYQTNGTITPDGGTLIVKGDYINAVRSESGNFTAGSGKLYMANAADLVIVEGDYVINSSSSSTLTSGTMKIAGNFTQIYGNGNDFKPSGTHEVILNGTSKQIIKFTSPYAKFNRLLLEQEESQYEFIPDGCWNILEDSPYEDPLLKPIIYRLRILPGTVEAYAGDEIPFTAKVTGANSPSQAVSWSVSGNTSELTAISETGVLFIADDETAAELVVSATSVFDSSKQATATVLISPLPAIHEHRFNAEVVEATCKNAGYTTYTCEDCGYTYISDYVPLKEHAYQEFVTEPTTEQQGYTMHVCTVCGHAYVDNFTNFLPGAIHYIIPSLSAVNTTVTIMSDEAKYSITADNGVFERNNIKEDVYRVYAKPKNSLTICIGEYDTNSGEVVNNNPGSFPIGDVNHDDVIDIADLSMLLATGNYGNANTEIDLTGDGMITIDDISLVLKATNFGMSSAKIV